MFFVIELKVLLSVGVSFNVLRYLSIHASEVRILSEHFIVCISLYIFIFQIVVFKYIINQICSIVK